MRPKALQQIGQSLLTIRTMRQQISASIISIDHEIELLNLMKFPIETYWHIYQSRPELEVRLKWGE